MRIAALEALHHPKSKSTTPSTNNPTSRRRAEKWGTPAPGIKGKVNINVKNGGGCVCGSHPSASSGQALSQKKRKMAHPLLLLRTLVHNSR